jgi:hypothetical protein
MADFIALILPYSVGLSGESERAGVSRRVGFGARETKGAGFGEEFRGPCSVGGVGGYDIAGWLPECGFIAGDCVVMLYC